MLACLLTSPNVAALHTLGNAKRDISPPVSSKADYTAFSNTSEHVHKLVFIHRLATLQRVLRVREQTEQRVRIASQLQLNHDAMLRCSQSISESSVAATLQWIGLLSVSKKVSLKFI